MVRQRALVIAPTLPAHDREGGSRDLADLVHFLVDEEWSVTYLAVTADASPRYVRELRESGVRVALDTEGIPESLQAEEAPDLVVIAFWHLAETLLPVVRRSWPETAVAVSSIDLHFVRRARGIFSALARGERAFLLDGFFADSMIREINTYAASDGVLAVSRKEAQLIGDLTGDETLGRWVPVTHGQERSVLPFEDRSGILFVGNFRHEPNVEAVEHLCSEIVPRLDPDMLVRHPVRIVGNAPDDRVRRAVARTPGTRLVGWVPSLTPYLATARVCVVPLLHGAGVKGKVVRSLAAGTPTVTTGVGVDGLDLEAGRDILVANDPAQFAAAVEMLVADPELWARTADAGREAIVSVHDAAAVRRRLMTALRATLDRPRKSAVLAQRLEDDRPSTRYGELTRKLRALAPCALDDDVTVLVVSRGDDDLLDLGGLRTEHFPQDENRDHLGWHPVDGADVIARLEAQQERGRHYLVLPITSSWWLHHYEGVAAHLERRYRRALHEEGAFTAWEYAPDRESDPLPDQGPATQDEARVAPDDVPAVERAFVVASVSDAARPTVVAPAPVGAAGRVLVVGVYLAAAQTYADDVVSIIAGTGRHQVVQQWVALGGRPPTDRLEEVTRTVITRRTPKFELVNQVIADVDLDSFDYLMLVDDDIALPVGFVDEFLGWQTALNLSLAQPARTASSFIDHRIVQQQPGSLARRTRFVEIGPVVSIHRSAYDLLLPFDMTSPMGWGYENVWTQALESAGLRMGIVDAVPVDHSLRAPVAHYSWEDADAQRTRLLELRPHLPIEECFHVLEVHPAELQLT